MKHTLVAAFDRPVDADRAKADLMSRGIAQTHIHLAAANAADMQAYESRATRQDPARISRFFRQLFGEAGNSRRYAEAFPEAIRRGSSVLAVDVENEGEMTKAIEALESNGAIDIDERSAGWGMSDREAGDAVSRERPDAARRDAGSARVRVVTHILPKPGEHAAMGVQHGVPDATDRQATPDDPGAALH